MDKSCPHSRRILAGLLSRLSLLVVICLPGTCTVVPVDCHMADTGCNPLATELFAIAEEINRDSSGGVVCSDPNYSAPQNALAVTNPADSGAGTLRQAITDVASGGAIDLGNVGGTITLTSNLPTISKDIEFYGLCDTTKTIDGNGAFRLFRVTGGATVSFFYLTLQNGNAPGSAGTNATPNVTKAAGGGGAGMGGGIYVDGSSQVTISNVIFQSNQASGGSGGWEGTAAAGVGFFPGTDGGGPAHESPSGGTGGTVCNAGTSGGFGTGGGGGCTDTAGTGLAGGGGGYGAGSGGGGSGSGGVNPSLPAGTFGGSGGTGCTTPSNSAAGGGGGGGLGGALAAYGAGTSLTITDSSFLNNTATGGTGGNSTNCNNGAAGQGKGGAIFIDAGAAVTQSNLTMNSNNATDQTAAANDNHNVYGFNWP